MTETPAPGSAGERADFVSSTTQKKRKRRKRKKLKRTKPYRDAGQAFSSSSGTGERNAFIEQSLENMYRIIEPWRAQGEEVAKQFSKAYAGLALPEIARNAPTQVMQLVTDLLAAYFNLVGVFTEWMANTGLPGFAGGARGASVGDEDSTGLGSAPIAVEVESRRRVVVHPELDASAVDFELDAPRFRKADGLVVHFAAMNSRHDPTIVVAVRVTKRARPGVYRSHVVNAYTGARVGEVTIEVQ